MKARAYLKYSVNDCGWKTTTCSCRKHELKCTDSCKECRGASCVNLQEVDLDVFHEHG